EPAMTLVYRAEYKKVLGDKAPHVQLIQEWLAKQLPALKDKASLFAGGDFGLLAHCTEKTNAVASIRDWQKVFEALGQSLKVIETGCCGMAGTYGHEAENVETSKKLYQMSWSEVVNNPANKDRLVAS